MQKHSKKEWLVFILSLFLLFKIIDIIFLRTSNIEISNQKNLMITAADNFISATNQFDIPAKIFVSTFDYGSSKTAFQLTSNIDTNKLLTNLIKNNYAQQTQDKLVFIKNDYIYTLNYIPKTNSWFLIIEKDNLINSVVPFINFYIYLYAGQALGQYISLVFPILFYGSISMYCYYQLANYKSKT